MVEFTIPIAFIAGIVSFLSPCVLPLVPAFLTFVAGKTIGESDGSSTEESKRTILFSSIFFVLGFTIVFSLLGVLLQGVLSSISYDLKTYLSYLGGAIIIFFGLTLAGILNVPALMGEYRIKVSRGKNVYASAVLFGAAFAVGWTPCVGIVLGSILTLAATQPQIAFPLMVSYSIGLGLPFIIAGAFISQSAGWIQRYRKHLKWLNIVFGILLVILGILVFTNSLAAVANLFPLTNFLGG